MHYSQKTKRIYSQEYRRWRSALLSGDTAKARFWGRKHAEKFNPTLREKIRNGKAKPIQGDNSQERLD